MAPSQVKKEEAILALRLVPPVRSLKLVSGKVLPLSGRCKVEIDLPEGLASEAVTVVADNFRSFWGIEAKVSAAKTKLAPPANREGYAIRITATKIAIAALSIAGLRYATYTLRQLAESERGVMTSTVWQLPCVSIEDEPANPFRGLHLCWFIRPETEAFEVERSIRMAAYYKYNYVVLESWGAIRFRSHPEFGWAEAPVEPGEVKRLVRLGRELGVTLIPQFNIFGHASASRSCIGKHALLALHPEFAPLFEPDGWCWCLSNPETRRFLTDIVEELDDLFDRPPFFHLGCDEARGATSCRLCRRADYPALLLDHLSYFNGILKGRGARPMIWHDMFLDSRDKRWTGYIVNGEPDYAALLEKLPKDFVLCDWQYGYPEKEGREPNWPTTRFFVEKGFDTIACPWIDSRGTASLGRMVPEAGARGILMTTWHLNHGSYLWYELYFGAFAGWNPAVDVNGTAYDDIDRTANFDCHVRSVNRDMGARDYEHFGTARRQIHGPFYQG